MDIGVSLLPRDHGPHDRLGVQPRPRWWSFQNVLKRGFDDHRGTLQCGQSLELLLELPASLTEGVKEIL